MKDWTLLDDARLLALLSKGWTRKKIAADFGVTRNAICGRIHRLVYKPQVQTPMPNPDDITPDQFAWLQERAAERREQWADHASEISFEELLEAEPMFEPPLGSMYEPYLWRIGQRVAVDNVRAFVNGERRFDDWSGTGTIDMIKHGGQYVRVVDEPYYAWVGWNNFDRMKSAPVAHF